MDILFIFINSADPDEMLQDAAFHLGLHCFPKYLFMVSGIKRINMYQADLASNNFIINFDIFFKFGGLNKCSNILY